MEVPLQSHGAVPEIGLPKVSILIPTHNRPHYLEIALNSALNQTYPNKEIIVSDNSDDNHTQALVAAYQEKHPDLVYLRTRNTIGIQNFFNAYKLATGEYVAYLMDDDVFHPEKLDRMVGYFITHPTVGLVTSYRRMIDQHGSLLPQVPSTERLVETDALINGKSLGKYMLEHGNNVVGEPTTAMVRHRDIPKGLGWFHDKQYRLLTDVATWLDILAKSDCVYISEPLSYFRLHDEQDQKSNNNVRLNASLEWFNLFLDAYQNNEFFDNKAQFQSLMTGKLEGLKYYIQTSVDPAALTDKIRSEIEGITSRAQLLIDA